MENQQNNNKQTGSEPTDPNKNMLEQDRQIAPLQDRPPDDPGANKPVVGLPSKTKTAKSQEPDQWPSVSWP